MKATVVASDHSVWHTKDGGASWLVQLVDSSLSQFVDITFINENIGLVSGPPGGIIYYTSNGGDTWSDRSVETAGRIAGISFISDAIGWGVGANCRIYKTVTAGVDWIEATSPRFANSVLFVDSLVGYVGNNVWASSQSDEWSNIFKTSDGGITWSAQDIPQSLAVGEFAFFDSDHGIATFVSGQVHYTTNGGENWNDVPELSGLHNNYIGFEILNSTDAYILAVDGEVLFFSIPQ